MGGYSQIKAEMLLLQTATRCGSYTYYHLLSGADLPLKTQDEIHEYFEKHQGEEFVRFQDGEFQFGDRVRYYHFFREILPRRIRSLWAVCLRVMDITSLMVQKAFGVNRNKGIKFQKGANWFSITDKFARYVIGQKEWIEKTFRRTTCCDEVFLQTLLVNSDFKDNCHVKEKDNSCESIKRFIDWERGRPYTFTSEDYDTLIHSNMLFARKFSDEEIEVVDMIKRFILHI